MTGQRLAEVVGEAGPLGLLTRELCLSVLDREAESRKDVHETPPRGGVPERGVELREVDPAAPRRGPGSQQPGEVLGTGVVEPDVQRARSGTTVLAKPRAHGVPHRVEGRVGEIRP
nr:hypothetical protein DA06_06930 [Georgenia sp. SUBG003]